MMSASWSPRAAAVAADRAAQARHRGSYQAAAEPSSAANRARLELARKAWFRERGVPATKVALA